MKKSKEQIVLIKDDGIRWPFFWVVVSEDSQFLHIRNWFTGENRVICK